LKLEDVLREIETVFNTSAVKDVNGNGVFVALSQPDENFDNIGVAFFAVTDRSLDDDEIIRIAEKEPMPVISDRHKSELFFNIENQTGMKAELF